MNTRNPRTGVFDYQRPELSGEEIAARCQHLIEGQKKWHANGFTYRSKILQLWKSVIHEHQHDLLNALIIDTGRVWETKLEIDLLLSSIDRWCKLAGEFFTPIPEKTTQIPFIRLQQDWVPCELVGVISPWNFPLLLSLIDTLPALLAGAAVVVKPSEVTPRFIDVMNKTINQVPALKEVLAYIPGD